MIRNNPSVEQAEPSQLWEQPPTDPATDLNSLAGNDDLPLQVIDSQDEDEPPYVYRDANKGLGVAAAALVAVTATVYVGAHPSAIKDLLIPKQEQVQPASSEAVEKANETARDLANGVIKILAKPGSGAEAYRGDMVGNKTAVIGPDGKYPSKDDNQTPESFVGFDPVAGEMYFSSTQGYFPNGIKKDDDFESTSINITFKVAKDNPIYDAKGQLQLADYEEAMSQPDTLELKSMEAALHAGIDPAPEVSITENEIGKLQAIVYENGQFDDYPGKSEALEGDELFDGVAARAEQVAEAALEDLQNSIR